MGFPFLKKVYPKNNARLGISKTTDAVFLGSKGINDRFCVLLVKAPKVVQYLLYTGIEPLRKEWGSFRGFPVDR